MLILAAGGMIPYLSSGGGGTPLTDKSAKTFLTASLREGDNGKYKDNLDGQLITIIRT